MWIWMIVLKHYNCLVKTMFHCNILLKLQTSTKRGLTLTRSHSHPPPKNLASNNLDRNDLKIHQNDETPIVHLHIIIHLQVVAGMNYRLSVKVVSGNKVFKCDNVRVFKPLPFNCHDQVYFEE